MLDDEADLEQLEVLLQSLLKLLIINELLKQNDENDEIDEIEIHGDEIDDDEVDDEIEDMWF